MDDDDDYMFVGSSKAAASMGGSARRVVTDKRGGKPGKAVKGKGNGKRAQVVDHVDEAVLFAALDGDDFPPGKSQAVAVVDDGGAEVLFSGLDDDDCPPGKLQVVARPPGKSQAVRVKCEPDMVGSPPVMVAKARSRKAKAEVKAEAPESPLGEVQVKLEEAKIPRGRCVGMLYEDGTVVDVVESDKETEPVAEVVRMPRGFKNMETYPPLVAIVYNWLATKPGTSLAPFENWLGVRVDLFIRQCVNKTFEPQQGPVVDYFVRTHVASALAGNIRSFMDRMFLASPKFFDSLREIVPLKIHQLSLLGLMMGFTRNKTTLVIQVVEASLSVCNLVSLSKLGLFTPTTVLALPGSEVADYTWLWDNPVPEDIFPRMRASPVVVDKTARTISARSKRQKTGSKKKDKSFAPDDVESSSESDGCGSGVDELPASSAARAKGGGKSVPKRTLPVDHSLFLQLPGGPAALAQIGDPAALAKLRLEDSAKLFVELFKHLTPVFREDVMDRLGLQYRPDEDCEVETCKRELTDLLGQEVNYNDILRMRLQTMTEARTKAGLVGFPFKVDGNGSTVYPKDFKAMIASCHMGHHVDKLVDAISDSFLLRHCLKTIISFFPFNDRRRKVLASERIFRALCTMDGLWKIYIKMGEPVVKSGSFFDVESRSFKPFHQTNGYLQASDVHKTYYRDTFAKLSKDGYPESAARRMAYNAFVKHPKFVSSSSKSSFKMGILSWAVAQPEGDPIRAVFVEAYPVDCGILVSRSTQHVQGEGWEVDAPSSGADYGPGDEPSDSNKLWAQGLRDAQAAAKK